MSSPAVEVRLLGPGDASVLERVAEEVFDFAVDARLAREFLADPRHHLAVALAEGRVVGIASAFHYMHPDKPAQLFVNEVGVAPAYRRRGIARALLAQLFAHAREVGCAEAWVGAEIGNAAARRLYAAAGGTEDPEPFVQVSFALDRPR